METIGIWDKVMIIDTGRIGVVTRDRMSGLYDVTIELDDPAVEPLQEQYARGLSVVKCGSTVPCCHPSELRLIKRFADACRK